MLIYSLGFIMCFILKSSAREFTALLQKHQRSLEVLILTSSVSLNLLFRGDLVHATSERLFISKWHTEKPGNCEAKKVEKASIHLDEGPPFYLQAFFDISRAKTGTKILYSVYIYGKKGRRKHGELFFPVVFPFKPSIFHIFGGVAILRVRQGVE